MEVHRGDIVLVELDPTKGAEIRKTRPAVVVQNDTGNQYSSTTIVPPMTTLSNYPFVVTLPADSEDGDEDSAVQLDQIRTVDIDQRMQTVLGRVSDRKMTRATRRSK